MEVVDLEYRLRRNGEYSSDRKDVQEWSGQLVEGFFRILEHPTGGDIRGDSKTVVDWIHGKARERDERERCDWKFSAPTAQQGQLEEEGKCLSSARPPRAQ